MLGDLELLFQEQLVALAKDVTEQNVARKGKAVITDHEPTKSHQQQDHPAVMVLEESAASFPTRPAELITSQLGGGFRWFIQHMPNSGNAAGRSSPAYQLQDNRQSSALLVSTSEDAEEELVAAIVTVGSAAVTTVAVEVEGPDQSADPKANRAEVAHRGYRNTRVSVTILKRH